MDMKCIECEKEGLTLSGFWWPVSIADTGKKSDWYCSSECFRKHMEKLGWTTKT
jgi:hypothetical protein